MKSQNDPRRLERQWPIITTSFLLVALIDINVDTVIAMTLEPRSRERHDTLKPCTFNTAHSYVLARETIWSPYTATRYPTPAPWPTRAEQVQEGQRRVARSTPCCPRRLDLIRCLPAPGLSELYAKWFALQGLVDPWAFDFLADPFKAWDVTVTEIQVHPDDAVSAIGVELLKCLGK